MEPSLLNADSPFVALHHEVVNWLQAHRQSTVFDDSHLQVMFNQCKKLVERLQKRGAVVGSSLNTAYLLERLSQTLERLETLMAIFCFKSLFTTPNIVINRLFCPCSSRKT